MGSWHGLSRLSRLHDAREAYCRAPFKPSGANRCAELGATSTGELGEKRTQVRRRCGLSAWG